MSFQSKNLSEQLAIYFKEMNLNLSSVFCEGKSMFEQTIIDMMASKRLANMYNRRFNGVVGTDYDELVELVDKYDRNIDRGQSLQEGFAYFLSNIFASKSLDFSVSQENLDAVLKRIPSLESYAAKLDNVRQHLIHSASIDSLTKTIDLFFEKAKSQSEDVLKVSVKIAQSVLENEAKKNVKIQMVSSIAEHLFDVDRIDDIVDDFGKSCSNRIYKGFTKGQLVESIKSHIVEAVMGMQDSKLLTPKVVDNYNEIFNNYFPNGQVNDSLAGKFAESYFVDRILPVNVKVIQDTQAFENYIDKKQNPNIKKTQKSIINDCASRALEILQEEKGLYTFDKEKARKDMVLADYRSGVLFDYAFKRLDNDERYKLGKVVVDTLMPATNMNFKREEKVVTNMEGFKENIGLDGLTA